MMIFFTALGKKGKVHEFACGLESLEANFDFLNSVVAEGHSLLTAYMLDGTSRTEIPLEVFDGIPVSEVFRDLQLQWEAILQPHPGVQVHKQEMIELMHRQIQQYNNNIAMHKRMISWFTNWLEQTEQRSRQASKQKLVQLYQSSIDIHQKQLSKSLLCSTLAVTRLNQLLA